MKKSEIVTLDQANGKPVHYAVTRRTSQFVMAHDYASRVIVLRTGVQRRARDGWGYVNDGVEVLYVDPETGADLLDKDGNQRTAVIQSKKIWMPWTEFQARKAEALERAQENARRQQVLAQQRAADGERFATLVAQAKAKGWNAPYISHYDVKAGKALLSARQILELVDAIQQPTPDTADLEAVYA